MKILTDKNEMRCCASIIKSPDKKHDVNTLKTVVKTVMCDKDENAHCEDQ